MNVGLELLFSTLKLRSKNDAIVALVHWTLVQNDRLCLGIGEDSFKDEKPSELLPKDWNSDQNIYTLRYSKKMNRFIVKIIPVENNLLINVTNLTKNISAAMSLVAEDLIDDISTYQTAYKDIEKLRKDIQTKIIDGPFPKVEIPVVPKEKVAEKRPFVEPVKPPEFSFQPIRLDPREIDPIAVGSADLYPGDLGFGGGGMLMNPRNLLRARVGPSSNSQGPAFPRGAVPPGARFDPFGPPMPDVDPPSGRSFGVPNPDHLPPPGFGGMFG